MKDKSFESAWAVILAGGNGTRFWPKSTQEKPKQLCSFGSDTETLLEKTLSRLDPIIPKERRIIVTSKKQIELTKKIAHKACDHFLSEPLGRNTANALALAAREIAYLTENDPETIMMSFHADHIIQEEDLFLKSLEEALKPAQKNYLTLIGIKPDKPETAFGYIKATDSLEFQNTYRVDCFSEKPDLKTAEAYVETGHYYWNSGLFVWKNSFFLEELKQYLPDSYEKLDAFYRKDRSNKDALKKSSFETLYKNLENISIDHALLEKSPHIAMISSPISWADVGSWDSLPKVLPKDQKGNTLLSDETFLLDTENCILDGGKKFVATIGVKDLVIVATETSILVCDASRAQEVKKVVEHLKESGKVKYL